ncbi:alpha/beta hydrolase family protein [Amycolatopsis sp. NPDC059090]|uniref:alpha/beta hydrolase family protein n=1 Tax=unclassified Amycolatopsis TaxID=2618356 RepID=UPI00366D5B2D
MSAAPAGSPGATPSPEQEMLNWGRLLMDGVPYADLAGARDRDPEVSWLTYWLARAAEYERLGDEALAGGHGRSAGDYFYFGSLAAQYAQFLWFGSDRAAAQDRKVELYRKAAPLLDPPADPVDLIVDGAPVRLYVRLPAGEGPHPAVVMLGGLESTKEESRLMEDLVLARGMATATFDGPGQGETFRHRALSGDFERFTSAVVDHLRTRGQIDPERIGVLGRSLGGNYALKSAACDPRLAACVCWGGFADMDEWDAETPMTKESWRYVSKVRTLDEAREHVRQALETRDVLGRLRCPTYVLHGRQDEIPIEFVDTVRRHVVDAPLTIVVEDEGDHCCHNLGLRPRLRMADWLADQLVHSGRPETGREDEE